MSVGPLVSTREANEKLSRPQIVAQKLKDLIVKRKLQPGDRLPSEKELIDAFNMAKGTIREAIRILEAQGLVRTRTGPGGGAFVDEPSEIRTQALLANYFYFRKLSTRDIYDLRLKLEPDLVASLAGNLDLQQIRALEDQMATYDHPPVDANENRQQHIDSLKFHKLLASFAPNEIMGFIVRFLTDILAELTVNKVLFNADDTELWKQGRKYHEDLLDALRKGDAEAAHDVMFAHMSVAKAAMGERELEIESRFMSPDDKPIDDIH